MADLNLTSVYETTLFGVQDGQAIRNVLHHAAIDDSPGPVAGVDTLLALAEEVVEGWRANILPVLVREYELVQAVCVEITNRDHAPPNATLTYGAVETLGLGGTTYRGARNVDALPTYSAVAVRKIVNRRGRKYRGSMRIGGVAEADTDENELTDTAATNFQTAVSGIHGVFTIAGGAMQLDIGVFAKQSYLLYSPGGANPRSQWFQVDNLTVQDLITSQVSRKRKKQLGA